MAITPDTAATGFVTDGTTVTFSITAASGAAIVVSGALLNGGPAALSATYNGNSLGSPKASRGNGNARVDIWAAIGVGTGTAANVIITYDINGFAEGGASTWNGVGSISATTAVAGTIDNAPTLNIATADANEVVVDALSAFNLPVATVGGGQTQRYNSGANGTQRGAGSSEPGTGGSVTMSWSLDASTDWALAAIILQASGGAATAQPYPRRTETATARDWWPQPGEYAR